MACEVFEFEPQCPSQGSGCMPVPQHWEGDQRTPGAWWSASLAKSMSFSFLERELSQKIGGRVGGDASGNGVRADLSSDL